jgi:hypothetical protein
VAVVEYGGRHPAVNACSRLFCISGNAEQGTGHILILSESIGAGARGDGVDLQRVRGVPAGADPPHAKPTR